MTKFKTTLAVLTVALALVGLGTLLPVNTRPMPVSASTSDKYDGDCPTPPDYATVGRCADKCPNATDTLLGFDPSTGAAICKSAPTGCPYADSIPLDSPKCVPPADTTTTTPPVTTEPANSCWGK